MPDAAPDLGEIRFRRRRDAGDVLNATVAFLRANARELARTYLVIVLPVALAAGVCTALYIAQLGPLFADPDAFLYGDSAAGLVMPYLGMLLFGGFGSALMLAAAGAYVRLYREGQTGALTAGELWEASTSLILPFLGLILLAGLAVMLSLFVAAIPCLGAIAWLAFLAWLVPRVMVTAAVRTLERPSLGASWRRAQELVKGSWGFSLGALLLAVIVFYAVILVVMVPVYVIGFVVELNGAGDPGQGFTLMGVLLIPLQALSYAGTLIPLVAGFFVHGRLVEELDGTSLYGDLDAIAAEAGTGRSSAFGRAPAPPATPSSAPPEPAAPPADPADDAPAGGFRGGGFGG